MSHPYLENIPPERLRAMGRKSLDRINEILTAQVACPAPFRMRDDEIAQVVLHHAENAVECFSRADEKPPGELT